MAQPILLRGLVLTVLLALGLNACAAMPSAPASPSAVADASQPGSPPTEAPAPPAQSLPPTEGAAPPTATEPLQIEIIETVRETTGAESGNGPAGTDPSHLIVEVYAERANLDEGDVARMEARVVELAATEGVTVSFEYGAWVSN